MKKILLVLGAAIALTSCREAGTAVQSHPSATGTADAKVLRFDTTFFKTSGARTYAHTYTGKMLVGQTKKVVVPVQINWTTVEQAGCPQVAAVQVYQLNGNDRRTSLMARAMRDAVCKPGPQPAGATQPAGSSPAYAGAAYLKLIGESREIHRTTSVTFTLNGLGYHDTLDGDSAATSTVQ
ncbi:membrane lipoprotein lipid attachment site-containing protein [Siccationidurans ginsengisoli]|nr:MULTISPECIES: membrane lipoprotein lipid attachment site-containing protein [unclassified Hymenobacter]MBO2032405.1 membrane lipoprotein lipid attachment site-containing protein [Hymenobacter sp. BT559]